MRHLLRVGERSLGARAAIGIEIASLFVQKHARVAVRARGPRRRLCIVTAQGRETRCQHVNRGRDA